MADPSDRRGEHRPSLAELLAPLDRDQLRALLLELTEQEPACARRIESRLLALRASPSSPPSGQPRTELPPVELDAIRKRLRATIRPAGRGRYSSYGQPAPGLYELREIAGQARPYLDAGDGRSALAILALVTDAFTENLDDLADEDGEASLFGEDLGNLLAEAVLTSDLSGSEREQWEERIDEWQGKAGDYGLDEGFPVARYAVMQGWDDPALQRVLAGNSAEQCAWGDTRPYCAEDLARVRLAILERHGRWDEYLRLAASEGQTLAYVKGLARRGRIGEAVEYGLSRLTDRATALALSRALDEAGASAEALQIAERALAAFAAEPYPTGELPRWTRDLAARLGRLEQALQAALTAVRERPTLADFLAAQALAGERWSELREPLLEPLRCRRSHSPSDEVDIFLHEGLIEDAMAAVDAAPRHALVERVVEAALPTHPDWAFRACTHQFDRIADAGKAQYYREAVAWLEKAGKALAAAGREEEWRSYLNDVIARHSRKYSLRPSLERLRGPAGRR
jgi:uncharacterized Zn finger protein